MPKRNSPRPRRIWTVLLVPPEPTGRTHIVRLHGGYVGRAAWTTVLTVVAYVSWSMAQTRQVDASATQLAEVHQLVLALSDSLQSANQRADSALRLAAVTANVAHGITLISRAAWHSRVGATVAGIELPVSGTITSRFSQSRWEPILRLFRPHEGVDIAAPSGTSIRTPADGRVISVGQRLGYGLVVELDHGGGVKTLYAHCQRSLVKKGDYVTAGAAIATVGSTGLSTAPHVHFEVIVNGQHVDPLKYLLAPAEVEPAATPTALVAADHE